MESNPIIDCITNDDETSEETMIVERRNLRRPQEKVQDRLHRMLRDTPVGLSTVDPKHRPSLRGPRQAS